MYLVGRRGRGTVTHRGSRPEGVRTKCLNSFCNATTNKVARAQVACEVRFVDAHTHTPGVGETHHHNMSALSPHTITMCASRTATSERAGTPLDRPPGTALLAARRGHRGV